MTAFAGAGPNTPALTDAEFRLIAESIPHVVWIAAPFQLVMIPSDVDPKIASPDPPTIAASCWRAASPALRSVMSTMTTPIPMISSSNGTGK